MKILIILGHPARKRSTFCEALADAYAHGAVGAGHDVDRCKVAQLQFDPVLHEGYADVPMPEPDITDARTKMAWADHIVFVYPLWAFMIPALLKGFLERTLILGGEGTDPSKKVLHLKGKTVRLIQTSGMPGFIYRFYYRARGAKALRDMLKFAGASSVHASYYGMIEAATDAKRQQWLKVVKLLGKKGR